MENYANFSIHSFAASYFVCRFTSSICFQWVEDRTWVDDKNERTRQWERERERKLKKYHILIFERRKKKTMNERMKRNLSNKYLQLSSRHKFDYLDLFSCSLLMCIYMCVCNAQYDGTGTLNGEKITHKNPEPSLLSPPFTSTSSFAKNSNV